MDLLGQNTPYELLEEDQVFWVRSHCSETPLLCLALIILPTMEGGIGSQEHKLALTPELSKCEAPPKQVARNILESQIQKQPPKVKI